jgi:hypothetical protein
MSTTTSTSAFRRLGLELIPLSAHEWRVSDPSLDERDGLSLLGFVEEVAAGYAVTAIGRPREHPVQPDLDSALMVLRVAHVCS